MFIYYNLAPVWLIGEEGRREERF